MRAAVKKASSKPFGRLTRLIDDYIEGRLGGVSRGLFVLVFLLWAGIQVVRSTVADRCLQVASSLAFKTILALVPLLAVGFALMKAFGAFDVDPASGLSAAAGLIQFVSENFIPVQGAAIAGQLQEFASRVSVGALGAIGVGFLLFMAIFLFLDIEKVFNDIFRTEPKKTLFQRFTKFYAIVTLGPALAALSLYQTAQYFGSSGLWKFVLPTLSTFAALVLSYKLLPDTRVRWPNAILGGLIAAILFEAAKVGFRIYVTTLALRGATAMYGALALFPIFLVWIWLTWLIVLFGCEIAHTAQNIHAMTELERGRRAGAGTAEAMLRRITHKLAAQVFLLIAERWARGGGPTPLEELRHAMGMAEQEASYLVKRFVQARLVICSGDPLDGVSCLPARPLGSITVYEVSVAPVSGDPAEAGEGATDDDSEGEPVEGNGDGSEAAGTGAHRTGVGEGASVGGGDAPGNGTDVTTVEVLTPREVLDRLLDATEHRRHELLGNVTYAQLVDHLPPVPPRLGLPRPEGAG